MGKKPATFIDEMWVYKINDDTTIKYIAVIKDITEEIVMRACEPYFDKKKSYMYDASKQKIAEYPSAVYRFGVVFAIKGMEEPGYCYRCSSKGKLIKTALVCPRCRSLIGGF